MLKSALWIFLVLSTPLRSWAAQPKIQISVNPSQVRNGESVSYKILVSIEERAQIPPPRLDNLKDFEILSSTLSTSPMVTSINGVTKYVHRSEFIYFLRPLRVGKLQIPPVEISINGRNYQTDRIDVQVDKLPGGVQSRPRNAPPRHSLPGLTRRPPLPLFPKEELDEKGGSTPPKALEIPKGESFFVRGFVEKNDYYEGELVDLSFYLFQRTRNLNAPEMAKFPEFKGFVKEELHIARNFEQERIQVGGEILLRSRLARYALFPVKTGKLKIDPLRFRAQVFRSMEDMIENLLQGVPPPNIGVPIPMEKSSPVIEINVKPLPETPTNATFTGGVGNFQMDILNPPTSGSTQQPFSLTLQLKGRGNLKLQQEIPLTLPKGLELYQTKGGTSELDESGYGTRTLEYLILPREAGSYEIKIPNWAFFDPEDARYEIIDGRIVNINIVGSSFAEQNPTNPSEPSAEDKLGPMRTGAQSWVKNNNVFGSRWASVGWIWLIPSGAYLLLGFAFVQIRSRERELAHLKNAPWEATARKIKAKDYKNVVSLAVLIDNYVRQRLSGAYPQFGLHSESTPEDFLQILRNNTKAEAHASIEALKGFWIDLDLLRFGGKSSKTVNLPEAEAYFPKAQKLCESVLAQKIEKDSSDEEDDDLDPRA